MIAWLVRPASSYARTRSRPYDDQGEDERQLECNVGRDPEPPARNIATVGLDEVRAARPSRVDDQIFVEAAAQTEKRECAGHGGYGD
jgi:hypothetical protein